MNKKGHTLLEIIVSISILSIMVALVFNFYSYSFKETENTINEAKINSHFNHIGFFLESNIENTTSIVELYGRYSEGDIIKNVLNEREEVILYNAKFINMYREETNSINDGFSIFLEKDIKNNGNTLKYNKNFGEYRKMELGNYIDRLYVKPLPDKSSFREAKGIKFIFKNKTIREDFVLEKSIYFKNR